MHPSPFHNLILHGENLFRTGYVHEALQVFESVIAQEPQHVLALNNKGVILYSLGRYNEAEQTFLDVLCEDNNNANAVFNLVSMYIESYNIKSAENILIRYGNCLNRQDIHELKEKLYNIQDEINTIDTVEKTKIVNISMDVHEKTHIVKFYLNEGESSHRVISACCAKNELYKSGLANFLASVLRVNDCFIDIGAHIGYFSLLGATLVGCTGQVFAFEPEEQNYRYLLENIALNNFDNIRVSHAALGLETKTSKIFINSDNDAGHALWKVGRHPDYSKSRMHCITRDVHVASLDSLLQGIHVSNLRLIHIDTCGAELDIIQGAVRTIEDNKVPYVVCGINRFGLQQMGTSEQELRQFMSYMGYETYCIYAEAPQLVSLAPEQYVTSQHDFHMLFASPAFLGEDNATDITREDTP
jgi:FkbM family methyltransferase